LRKDLGGLFLVLALACGCGRGAGGDCQTRFLSIGTGGTGGVYYPYGGALARLISEELPCVQATAEVTGASVDNLKLLQQGKVDLAFTLADTLAEAAAGTGPFAATGAVGDARVVAVLYTNYTHVVVRRDSGIRRVADLRGKVVSVGSPGSGTELIADRVLGAAGLDGRKDVTRHGLGVSESAGAMKDRKLDAFFWSGGLPTAAVEDLAATPGLAIDLLPQDDLLPALQAGARGGLYRLAVIPAGAYRGVDRETPSTTASCGTSRGSCSTAGPRSWPRTRKRRTSSRSAIPPGCRRRSILARWSTIAPRARSGRRRPRPRHAACPPSFRRSSARCPSSGC
jgi:TRAP transporter TAXI family solute receptor